MAKTMWEAQVDAIITGEYTPTVTPDEAERRVRCPKCDNGIIDEAWNPPGCRSCLTEFTGKQVRALRKMQAVQACDE